MTNGAENKWFGNLFVRKLDPIHESHSDLLAKSSTLYELQIHNVKPSKMGDYLTD